MSSILTDVGAVKPFDGCTNDRNLRAINAISVNLACRGKLCRPKFGAFFVRAFVAKNPKMHFKIMSMVHRVELISWPRQSGHESLTWRVLCHYELNLKRS